MIAVLDVSRRMVVSMEYDIVHAVGACRLLLLQWCLNPLQRWMSDHGNGHLGQVAKGWSVADEFQFERYFYSNDIKIDLQLDEGYVWEARKPAIVFSALYNQAD